MAVVAVLLMGGCGSLPAVPDIPDNPLPPLPGSGADDAGGGSPGQGDGEVHSSPETVSLAALAEGEVEFQTYGIRHMDERKYLNPLRPLLWRKNADGGWEYIFLSLFGEGFDRVILFHAGGPGRAVRWKVGTNPMQMEVASDNLPDWHTWKVKWGGGKMRLYLDGQQIGRAEEFTGKVSRVIYGGYIDNRRNFKGKWRHMKE